MAWLMKHSLFQASFSRKCLGPGKMSIHDLVARVRPARRIAQVEALLDEFGQAEAQGQGGRQDQSGIGHQAAVVEGGLDPVGVVAW